MGKRSKRKDAKRQKAIQNASNREAMTLPRVTEEAEPNRRNRLKSAGGQIVAIIGFVSALAGLYAIWPRPVATIGAPFDSKDPFSATAAVTNNGILTLHDVYFELGVKHIDFGDGAGLESDDESTFAALAPLWFTHEDLPMDKGFDFALNKMITADKDDLRGADIGVAVRYKIPFFSHTFTKVFGYRADRQTDGNFYWYKYAAAEQSFEYAHGISGPIHIPHRPKK